MGSGLVLPPMVAWNLLLGLEQELEQEQEQELKQELGQELEQELGQEMFLILVHQWSSH